MEIRTITLKIKFLSEKVFQLELPQNSTILQVKQELKNVSGVPEEIQKLIFKGKILSDNETLTTLKVESGSTMHLVQTKANPNVSNTVQEKPNTTLPSQQSTNSQNTGVPQNLASGGFGLLNSLGYAPTNTTNPNDPRSAFMNQMMENLFANPEMLQTAINMNPMLKEMVESNPELKSALSNPEVLRMLRDPQVINSAMGMMNRMGPSSFNPMMGNTQSFPAPGGGSNDNQSPQSQTNQPNQTETSTTQPQPQPQPQQNPLFANMGQNPFMGLGMGMNPLLGAGGGSGTAPNPYFAQMYQNMMMGGGLGGQPQPSQNPFNNQLNPNPNISSTTANTNSNGGGTQNPFMFNPSLFNPLMSGGNQSQGFNPFGFGPRSEDNSKPPEERYKEQLEQLKNMGFINKELNLQVLQQVKGNVDLAVDRILNMLGK